jgi:uncharacterized membrane protein
MSVPARLSFPRADIAWTGAAVAAAAVFLSCWGLLHTGLYADFELVDTPTYEEYGEALADGRVPYADYDVEYPPGALLVFFAPAVAADGADAFRSAFEVVMAVCGVALVLLVAVSLRLLGADPVHAAVALAVIALSPVALGTVILTRFDLWPAALVAAAVAALLGKRPALALGLLGAAVAAKLYALVLLPVALVYVVRRWGRRVAGRALGAFAVGVGVFFVPAMVMAPRGVVESLAEQAGRPLQIESFGSALLLAAHHFFGLGLEMRTSHGSQTLAGGVPDAVAAVTTLVQLSAVAAIWIWFARGPATRDRLVRACAAALVATVAFGKVFSPQFVLWLLPLVPLVRGRRGLSASMLLAAALVVTQLWFPGRYWALALDFDGLASAFVLVRDLIVVALLVLLVAPVDVSPVSVKHPDMARPDRC